MNRKEYNNEQSLNACNIPGLPNDNNIDPVPKECLDDKWPSQKRVNQNPPSDWRAKKTWNKLGLGQHGNCDPIQTGQIVNDTDTPEYGVAYQYPTALRGTDEAMTDLFRNMTILDENGNQHPVPIIWGTQERAVAFALQDNVRKDNSLVVDRIRLPMMAIYRNGLDFDRTRYTYHKAQSYLNWLDPQGGPGFTQQEKYPKDTWFGVTRGIPLNMKYTLYLWTMFEDDMNYLQTQVLLRFSPVAYLRVAGVWWEIIVTMDGQGDNLDLEPGDSKLRIFKAQFNMTAQSYLPQPITRYKAGDDPAFYPMSQMDLESLKETMKELED